MNIFYLKGSFTIHLEDHTIGNLLRMQLLQLPETLFSGKPQQKTKILYFYFQDISNPILLKIKLKSK